MVGRLGPQTVWVNYVRDYKGGSVKISSVHNIDGFW